MRTDTVDLKQLGRIDLVDLRIINEFMGGEFLPFPFLSTQPERFTYFDEYTAYARSIPDRFNHGDLMIFKKWFTSFAEADLRVECRVQHFAGDTPTERILAHRTGQRGFLAIQRPDDAVDIFTLSPYDLGPAIAASVDLGKPGGRPAVVISEYVPQALRDRHEGDDVDHGLDAASPIVLSSTAVSAYATVQSHSRPARDWGVDQQKDAVVWISLADDGDYVYVPGYRYAKPMTRQELRQRIDHLIAADVAILRRFRDG
ncbi:hypothetical protein A5634_21070 [Mycobacterium asiaticum]|uniref:ESX secretion-associated protein EspG n=1 Tax=Mycobacterium asiaticum TaxID=1790 RepID=A0A1A3P1N7_MYCAS|nr:ESX secretion-associated protein EspG [Mycobacterium asiaticum]OBK28168.1 hypothetical protein A5634_21070 [Mycobacterium asiaticum]